MGFNTGGMGTIGRALLGPLVGSDVAVRAFAHADAAATRLGPAGAGVVRGSLAREHAGALR